MKDHELKAIIRAKNEAWRALTEAETRCLAYQRSRAESAGYPTLPDGWEERRAHLREVYREARTRYMRAMLRRRR